MAGERMRLASLIERFIYERVLYFYVGGSGRVIAVLMMKIEMRRYRAVGGRGMAGGR